MKTNTFPEISAIVIVALALFSICFPNPGGDRTSAHHGQSSANSIEIVGRSTRILGQQHPLFGGASNQGLGRKEREHDHYRM